MARKRKGISIDGWLAIDKPLGIGSTQVVSLVRRLTNAAKVGHGGTLDPLASGILPIALGEATKTVAYVMDGAKTYRFQVRWGQATATDDKEGEITETSDVRPTPEQVFAVLPRFVGAIEQVPPAYSAIKVDGERAYDLARAGEIVELKARVVHIKALRFLGAPDPDHADFEVECGKGTYVRSLGRDIAHALGTLAHISLLRRVACGPFNETNAIPLDKFKEVGQGPALRTHLLPVKTALDDIPALALTDVEARRLQSGQALSVNRLAHALPDGDPDPELVFRAMDGERLVALARIEDGAVRSVRVMNLQPVSLGEGDVDHSRAQG
ncbi:tRNA pseudouridine(55) synthase TruB [Magnetospirillum aberrantis]|uniref:tRNA pseudouridine synthase B n=1 Tax=Magnetospirillum aberrantis SpK TaxID=908842 RepID=A0A7C9QWX6_9PROT|nr:tRNA pseudouridine(55) synthase TruB [Magnetospirillum aberrantis]NFV82159.1 tRNA pseudouridine(55) synthase TruB [Magnetospirillum aberrantis SpK]